MLESKTGAIAASTAVPSVQLRGARRKASGRCVFPEIPVQSVLASAYEPITLSTVGRLYSHTTIYPTPKSGLSPVILVYIDFPEEVRAFGRLTLPAGDLPQIGMEVRAVLPEDAAGDLEQYVFVPVESVA